MVKELNPDVAIVATGAESLVPNIPGIDGKKVLTAHKVLAGEVIIPNGKVLVIGGGMVGCEVSKFLATPGDNPIVGRTEVTIIEMLDDIGCDMVPEVRVLTMEKLRDDGVTVHTSTKVKEFLEDGAIVIKGDTEEKIIGMDFIVLAMGAKSVDVLSDKIKDAVPEVHVIGDAKLACRALEAIADGAHIGRQI